MNETLFELNEKPTHGQLVDLARLWLRKQRCSVITSEIKSVGWEQPDAIGWYGLNTILVECKVSRSDFLADRKKPFRQPLAAGLGDFRWYFAEKGIIRDESELPELWGWLEYSNGKIKTRKKAEPFTEKSSRAEAGILLSLLKRIGQNAIGGTSITCYTYETKNTTVLEIEKAV